MTIADSLEDESETQAATVDFSRDEVSITRATAAAATESGERETKFSFPDAPSSDHLQSGKNQSKHYSELRRGEYACEGCEGPTTSLHVIQSPLFMLSTQD